MPFMNQTVQIANHSLLFDVSTPYSYELVFKQFAEKRLIERFCNLLKEDDIVYDIGAAFGSYAIPASYFCKKVYAFEPYPENILQLHRNIELNRRDNIEIVEKALSNTEADTNLYFEKDIRGLKGCPSLIRLEQTFSMPLRTTCLDTFSSQNDRPTVCKIDIEGGEILMLEGGQKTLGAPLRLIQLEIHDFRLRDVPNYWSTISYLMRGFKIKHREKRGTETETLWIPVGLSHVA